MLTIVETTPTPLSVVFYVPSVNLSFDASFFSLICFETISLSWPLWFSTYEFCCWIPCLDFSSGCNAILYEWFYL